MTAILNRQTFEISRELEFFSEKELSMQLGHGRRLWPAALLKELIDNSLDACETAGLAPQVELSIEDHAFTVQDNGPGLPVETLTRSLDYLKRVSDKAFYVSPTRGQLGNALKTVWAAPFVNHGAQGMVEIWSLGLRHTVNVCVDRIAGKPAITHTAEKSAFVKNGTFFKIHWPNLACSIQAEDDDSYQIPDFRESARELIEGYAAFNSHATFRFGDAAFEASEPGWRKWKPNDPTSAHWYTPETLRDLIAAYLIRERDGGRARPLREFIAEFRGLAGTAKQKAITSALGGGLYLQNFATVNDIDLDRVARLLELMKAGSQAPKPAVLGIIGEEHFKTWMTRYAEVGLKSIRYARRLGNDGLPYVLEVTFGIRNENEGERRIVTGLNFSPTLDLPATHITQLLGALRVDKHDPVTILIHIARPRFDVLDRGKGNAQLSGDLQNSLTSALKAVCKEWQKAKRHADKQDRVSSYDLNRLRYRPPRLSIRDAAFDAMEAAYLKASDNGRLPANARQIYYAARGPILAATGADELNSQYFTQTLLKDYMEENNPAWDVVFDARGHITEPHTGEVVGLGGLAVRRYVLGFTNGKFDENPRPGLPIRIPTTGPSFRYGAVVFIEKEGFDPILEAARIAERFDVAIASTKGMPVSALCDLLATLKEQGRKVYVVHDFDKSGFSIVGTLRRGTRGSKGTGEVIDMGLRLEDIEGLEREKVTYRGDPTENLEYNGATKEEIEILVPTSGWRGYAGERVELNAMTSAQFIAWLERKLTEQGINKLVPDAKTLQAAYRRAVFLQNIQGEIERIHKRISEGSVEIPDKLEAMVRRELKGRSGASWDEAVWSLARRQQKGE